MSKKSQLKKKMLGHKLKQARRLPALARIRTHQRLQQNLFGRDWRHRKMRIEVD